MDDGLQVKPRCTRKGDDSIHINYELPYRVYVAKVYPVRAPNGSTVVVCGHAKGLTLFWRGGKQLKRQRTHSSTPTSRTRNGATSDADSDIEMDGQDEAHLRSSPVEQFEETDQSSIYPPIIDSFNIEFDAPALHVAFPPCSSQTKAQTEEDGSRDPEFPDILIQDIVILATCSDSSTRLVTVPLMPLGTRSQQQGAKNVHNYEEIILTLPHAQRTWREVPTDVALTWTPDTSARTQSEDQDAPTKRSSKRSRSRHRGSEVRGRTWTFIIAIATSEVTGLLKIYEIDALCSRRRSKIHSDSLRLVATEYLHSFAKKISFKPTIHPSPSHTQLLILDSEGSVQLYDSTTRPHSQGHLGGQWLLKLYGPFQQPRITDTAFPTSEPREDILDASWALNGGCIVVLTAQGIWGIWDVNGVSPDQKAGLLRGDNAHISNIIGSGVTPFALRGSVGKRAESKQDATSRQPGFVAEQEPKKLAPMTPNTRKAKQNRLFTQKTNRSIPMSSSARGGIRINSIFTSDKSVDDSMILWYDGELHQIPSLRSYWQNAIRRSAVPSASRSDTVVEGTPFGATIQALPHFSTGGEAITNVSEIPSPIGLSNRHMGTEPNDTLISAEHRLIVIQPHRTRSARNVELELTNVFEPPAGLDPQPSRLDQELLTRGELDLGGMNRLLDGMKGPQDSSMDDVFSRPSQRRVGFAAGI